MFPRIPIKATCFRQSPEIVQGAQGDWRRSDHPQRGRGDAAVVNRDGSRGKVVVEELRETQAGSLMLV